MRRFPLNAGASSTSNGGIIIAPPPISPGAPPCTCSDLGIRFADGTDSASVTVGTLSTLVATGTICADTVWTINTSWTPDDAGAAPVMTEIGASAWSFTAPSSGVLTISASALCGGLTINAGSVTLTITAAGGGSAQWVDISTLPITLEAIGGPTMGYSGGVFSDSQLQQVPHSIDIATATIGYVPTGLDAAVGAVYARLRIRIASFDATGSVYNGYACGVDIPGETSVSDAEVELGPVKLSDVVIVGGANSSGDQIGSFEFAVDVEVFQP